MAAVGGSATGRWRLRQGDAGRAVVGLAGAAVGLLVASWLVPGVELTGPRQALAVAVCLFVGGAVLRPVLVQLAAALGWAGAVLIGLFGEAVVLAVVLGLVPFEPEPGWWETFLAAWIVAAVSTLLVWVATAGTDDAVTAGLVRRARRRRPAELSDADVPGVVFVQADGVPYPVLEWGVRAGTLPTLSRWIRSGSHRMAEWRPVLPATTPASQMGILHGTIEGIPAFRWVDRTEGRVYVANKPADAAVIEARHSDGRGLLADDGVSVSNLFTGDASTAYATMSAVNRTQETRESRLAISRFLASPGGMARSMTRSVSEVLRERFQASRARRRDVRPRVHRGWSFAAERAALSGVLRDLNTSLVADAMLSGRRSVYVDYVDYDAVAHHAGVMQPESLAALEGIDAVLAQLEAVAEVAPRRYHLVVLSDHGQSQGEVFADRYGEDLAGLVRRLAGADVVAADRNAEGAGAVHTLVAGASSTDSVVGRAFGRASQQLAARTFDDAAVAEDRERAQLGSPDEAPDEFLVFGSGNLGLVYVAGEPARLTLNDLVERYPGLVPGLAAHPGIGFVVVDTVRHGPVAVGAAGEHQLRDGVVVGEDPLAPFGPDARAFVLRAASMPEAPDVMVNSLLDDLGEVAAFEGLVGCHGGLGGWQDRAMLVWPRALPEPEGMVVGADALHRVLVGWLEHLGQRGRVPRAAPAGAAARPG